MTPLTPQQAALVDTARLIAHSAHAGDRWGPHPYVTHLSRVVDVLQETYPEDASLHAAGWLHDTLEDTAHTTETLYEALHAAGAPWGADATQDVLSLVAAVTKPAGLSRKQSRAYHHATVTFGGPRAVALKVADRLVNMRGSGSARDARLYRMYQQEHHAFRHTLRDPLGSPRLEVLWGALDAEFERERVRVPLTRYVAALEAGAAQGAAAAAELRSAATDLALNPTPVDVREVRDRLTTLADMFAETIT